MSSLHFANAKVGMSGLHFPIKIMTANTVSEQGPQTLILNDVLRVA